MYSAPVLDVVSQRNYTGWFVRITRGLGNSSLDLKHKLRSANSMINFMQLRDRLIARPSTQYLERVLLKSRTVLSKMTELHVSTMWRWMNLITSRWEFLILCSVVMMKYTVMVNQTCVCLIVIPIVVKIWKAIQQGVAKQTTTVSTYLVNAYSVENFIQVFHVHFVLLNVLSVVRYDWFSQYANVILIFLQVILKLLI